MSNVPPIIIEILANTESLTAGLDSAKASIERLTEKVNTSSAGMVSSLDKIIEKYTEYDFAVAKAAASSSAQTQLMLAGLGKLELSEEEFLALVKRVDSDVAVSETKAALNAYLVNRKFLEDRLIDTKGFSVEQISTLTRMYKEQDVLVAEHEVALNAAAQAAADASATENEAIMANIEFYTRLDEQIKRTAALVEEAAARRAAAEEAAAAKSAAAAEAAAVKEAEAAQAAFKGKLSSIGDSISGVGQKISSIGQSMTFDLTLPIVGVGVAATAMAVHFSNAMMKVGSLTNASQEQVKAWSGEVVDLSSKYGVAASDAAEALYLIASNNLTGKAASDALNASMEASATGLGKVGDIARLTSSIMNAYSFANINAKQATDVLVASAREGHMNTETLANAFSRVLPVASAMKVPLADVGAAFAVISREGMNSNEAATAIRAMFSQLEKNSNQTAKGLQAVGLSAQGLRDEISQDGLLKAMETLRTATGGNDAALSKIFGNVRGLTGVLNILGQNQKSVADGFDRVRNSVGSTDKAFQEASKTLGFQFNQAFTQLKNSLISIGDVLAPIVAKVATFIASLVAKFQNLSDGVKQFIVWVGLAVAAIGPFLMVLGGAIAIIGGFVGSIISAVTAVIGLATALPAAIALIAPLLPEILAIGAGITAVIAVITTVVTTVTAVFVAAWANSEKLRNSIVDAFNLIKDAVVASFQYIQGKLSEHAATIARIEAVFQHLGDFLSVTIVPLIKYTLSGAFQFLAVGIGIVIDAVAWLVDRFKAGIQLMVYAAMPLVAVWNALNLAFDHGNHQILLTNDLFSVSEKKADLMTAANERLSTSFYHVANAAAAARGANALALDKADLTPASEPIAKPKPPPGPPGPKPVDKLKEQATQIKSDIEKQVTEALSLVKSLQKLGQDAKEQFTALSAGGERTDLPSVISKAFGEKGSVDSAISEFTRLNDGLKNASDAQRSILRNMVQQSIDLMTQNAAIKDSIQQAQDDLGKATDAIKSKYDALDKAAAAATAAIKARYDALLPTLETALSDANKAFDKENAVLDKLISARQSAMDSIQSGFTSFVNDMNLDPRARTFTRSLELRLEEVKAFTANIKTLLDKGVNQDLVQQFIQAGPSSAGATVKQLAGASAETIAHVNDMQNQLTTQITGFQSLVSAKWHDAGIAQQQAIVEPLKTAAALAQKALDDAKKSQASELAAAEAYAAQLKAQREAELATAQAQFDAFSAEMQKKIDTNNAALNANAQKIDKTITDLAATLQAQALDAGINAVNSLAGGLSNSRALANLVAKAKAAAQAAIQAMKAELGIASPSKVTMEIGGNVAAGLAKGMASENGMVGAAAAGLARMATPNIPYRTLTPYGSQPRTPVSSNVSNNNNITVNAMTNADPHKIAREVAWLVKVGV